MLINKIISQINENPGYSVNSFLNIREFEIIKDTIYSQWRENINCNNPEIIKTIENKNLDIKNYHEISQKLNHSDLWGKRSRILPYEFYKNFKNSLFFAKLKNIFGDIEISDEENLGFGNIYWRLVRPFAKADVGPLHRDSWFWELNDNFSKPNYSFSRIKVWIAIETEEGKSGLLVESNSHKRNDLNWKGTFRDGIMKPELLDKPENFNVHLVNIKPGDCILFNDNLLHGGALNTGLFTRVSTEFTILLKNN